MMQKGCENLEINIKDCNCTYVTCEKRGKCCECIRSHRIHGELPACFFPPEVEKTYDRSVARFISIHKK